MSRALPFSDRVIFAVRARRRTARTLSRKFGKDVMDIYKVLEGLEDQGIVRRHDGEEPVVWGLADGVEVDYRPGRDTGEVRVQVDGEDPRKAAGDGDEGRCTAVTTQGKRCGNSATDGTLCWMHRD